MHSAITAETASPAGITQVASDVAHNIARNVERDSELGDFDGVVARYWPRIYRFALVSLRDKCAAENLAQDCFMRAWKGRHNFRGDSALSTWLMQIAVNLIRDHTRNRRLRFWRRTSQSSVEGSAVAELLVDNRSSPEMSASARQQLAHVWSVTASLPERQRTVFLLRFVEDLSLLEIAAATGLSEGTVKVHLFRALNTVRLRSGIGKREEKP
ncbi:MAG TPA: sigma-70 family RNA polymerase sigma factor [Bryobacteraceae bacterium]|nr:sigma-70 family RNA polymerase sigma factor [Bryobacteraceae bacterium]